MGFGQEPSANDSCVVEDCFLRTGFGRWNPEQEGNYTPVEKRLFDMIV
jgi:hypothetical protein